MTRERDAVLAGTLLCITLLFGWLGAAAPRGAWFLGGVGATVLAEVLAYRRAAAVRAAADRRWVVAASVASAGAAIGAGAMLVPDRAISFATGALCAYLCLLGIATASGWRPTTD
ncbi:hypothetical protein L593_13780 [Salinarchaeum sp. Harcht-Bsk1]|uniref:hypothetical protein n=1 Tax=Salinarchaeum sp. Harcht-Bsk1 TaxID=1333523 RepID=UPI0003422AD0|nr:hypothetical protein [Salinarchaeum sp. Harcht-Bsk1]AGN02695.1 hypothetical protein L593_13780 [Salinarchaeum sp. Harcht-Bsk1]